MPDTYLKAGEVADPFNNRVKGKDQDRVPSSNAAPQMAREPDDDGDDADPKKRKKTSLFMPQTRLAKY